MSGNITMNLNGEIPVNSLSINLDDEIAIYVC